MKKTKRTISVDPTVWRQTQEKARQLRLSASWVAEDALRRYLKPPKKQPKEDTCLASGA